MPTLEEFGWNAFFAKQFEVHAGRGAVPGRIALETKGAYRIYTTGGELNADVSGRLLHRAVSRDDLPAAGDWVALQPRWEERKATIQAVLPRRTRFARKAAGQRAEEQIVAANVDTVFLVTSLNHDFNLRRTERYLAAAWESMARPVVVLSKADLCDDAELDEKLEQLDSVALGVPAHAISVIAGRGLDELQQYFQPGQTVALLGSSGVGKSSLINRLTGREILRTQEVLAGDDRGRHTTSSRQLILLPGGGLILDTPGMRELQLWDDAGLGSTFEDIEALAAACRFRDCAHGAEPGCAVREALSGGALNPARYDNYRKLQRELHHLAAKQDMAIEAERKKRWKKIMIDMRRKGHRW